MTTEFVAAGKVALVTGANKGIGQEIAGQLAELGMTVFATARDPERGEKTVEALRAGGADVRFLQLDVTDEASAQAAAGHVEQAFGRLDVLVNNAGIGAGLGLKPSETGVDAVRRTYEVNVLGTVAVTNAFLPLLRRSTAARIVNVSSSLGSLTLNADPEQPQGTAQHHNLLLDYNSSKAALNAVTVLYANELRDAGILVNAINPGFCATDLTGHNGQSSAVGAKVAVEAATLGEGDLTGSFLTAGGTLPW